MSVASYAAAHEHVYIVYLLADGGNCKPTDQQDSKQWVCQCNIHRPSRSQPAYDICGDIVEPDGRAISRQERERAEPPQEERDAGPNVEASEVEEQAVSRIYSVLLPAWVKYFGEHYAAEQLTRM